MARKRWLDSNKTETWIIYFIIVVVILMMLAAVGYMTGRWYIEPSAAQTQSATPLKLMPPHPPGVCGTEQLQTEMRAIMAEGLDEALRDRTRFLFEVWMKDEKGQPTRAAAGLYQSINAYVVGRASIEKWELPRCR